MDLSSSFDIPNPFGLLAADFGHDLDSYRAALGFLADLATGSEHDTALTANGGNKGLLIGWKRSDKFRRVYAKCQKAGEEERALAPAEEAWENEGGAPEPVEPPGQRFIRFEDMPAPPRSPFRQNPSRASWGSA